jgi:hypothetical protein
LRFASRGSRLQQTTKPKVLALCQGLCLLKNKGTRNFVVVSDSLVIIKYMNYHIILHGICLGQLIFKSQSVVDSDEIIDFHEVLRTHNTLVDEKENETIALEPKYIRIN